MATPYTTPLVRATRQYLAADTELTALLGSDEDWDTWIFPVRLMSSSGTIENSESVAITLEQDGAWAPPNSHNSMEFPRLIVNIYADPQRNAADGSVFIDDAQDKILRVKKVLDRLLHMSERHTSHWDTLRVIGSTRLGEVEFYPVRDGNGLTMGSVFYGVSLG